MTVETSDPVVELDGVSVSYGAASALRDVTTRFAAPAVGLLGPNGAGKSTLIKALLGFLVPTAGQMRVLGHDVARSAIAIRARVGYMPENDAAIPGMNAVSFVAYCGELSGLPRVDAIQRAHEVLFYVGLGDVRYRAIETYSTGMKQRIKLAQALVHDPDLVFLDEPTNGMDPPGRDDMLRLVSDLAHNRGIRVIVSSHLLPDVEQTCDDVVVMDKGRVVAAGPIVGLKETRGAAFEVRVKAASNRAESSAVFLAALRAAGIDCRDADADVMRLLAPEGVDAQRIFSIAAAHGVQIRHFTPSVMTLDDVFARAVGDE